MYLASEIMLAAVEVVQVGKALAHHFRLVPVVMVAETDQLAMQVLSQA
jgi:hypothetical protein